MPTIAILEGCDPFIGYNTFRNDVDLLGWPKLLRPSTYKKAIRKVARPIARVTRTARRRLDRTLKRIPVVRTVYRAGITATYATTGQFRKVGGAARRTARAAGKDFGGMKRGIKKIAIKVLTPLARKGMSKTVAKVTAIPTISAMSATTFGPQAIPFVAGIVNWAINVVWKKIKGVAKRVAVRTGKRVLGRVGRLIGGKRYEAQKMLNVPEVSQGGGFAPPDVGTSYQSEPKTGGAGIALMAIPALVMLMGV